MAVRRGVRYRIIVLPTICRGGRLCPPSKSGDFSRSFVGADAHIGPLKCCDFASDFHKTGQFRRADRVVRPYGAKSKISTLSPENRHKTGASCGSMRRPQASFEAQPRNARLLAPRWASTPTLRNGKRGDFPRPSVGADAYIGPLKCCDFASDFHKSGQFRRADRVVRPYGVKNETLYNNALPPPRGGVFILEGGSMWASTPTLRNGKRGDFSRSFVGADAHIGPLKCCDFASDFHKTGQFRRADRVVRPYGAKWQTDTGSAGQTSAPPRMSMTFPSSVRRSVSQQVMSTCPERI